MKNTRGLRQYAQEKRREAEQRVDQAIRELVMRGEAVTFYRISAVADVSKSYLYTRRELRERIEALRLQGRERLQREVADAPSHQARADATVTEKGKDVLLAAKQRRIEVLESENRRLKEELRSALGKLYAQA